jgi:signal recognition particle receptor subunit beta
MRPANLIGTSGFIFVIDATRIQTFQNYKEQYAFLKSSFPKAVIISIANKMDLIDVESFKKQLSILDIQIDFITSAKTGEKVEELFHKMGKELQL